MTENTQAGAIPEKNNEAWDPLEPDFIMEWSRLSETSQCARHSRRATDANDLLEQAARKHEGDDLANMVSLWIAENHVHAKSWKAVPEAFNRAESSLNKDRLLGVDTREGVIASRANALESGPFSADSAVKARTDHIDYLDQAGKSSFVSRYKNGVYLMDKGLLKDAKTVFANLATMPERPDSVGDPAVQLEFLEQMPPGYRNPNELCYELLRSLQSKDELGVREMMCPVYFQVGVAAAHSTTADPESNVERLLDELRRSRVSAAAPVMDGNDRKRYIHTKGWRGRWFRHRVSFKIENVLGSWHWTGIVVMTPTRPWLDQFPPIDPRTNQPLVMPIKAPWPAREYFMAGGIQKFGGYVAAISAAVSIPFVGAAVAVLVEASLAARRCGYGPRGFYYNSALSATHQARNAFAVDFTRYQRFLPHIPATGGTPVLATQQGFVSNLNAGAGVLNFVEIQHGNFFTATGTGPITPPIRPTAGGAFSIYLSRYLHLAGPGMLNVALFDFVRQGARLGLMNDTGNSVYDHLHFSVHDNRVPAAGVAFGASVRPTPIEGRITLNDGDDGACIRSSNIPFPP